MSLVAGFHNSSSMTVTVIFVVNYSDFVLISYVFHLCWQCLVEEVNDSSVLIMIRRKLGFCWKRGLRATDLISFEILILSFMISSVSWLLVILILNWMF